MSGGEDGAMTCHLRVEARDNRLAHVVGPKARQAASARQPRAPARVERPRTPERRRRQPFLVGGLVEAHWRLVRLLLRPSGSFIVAVHAAAVAVALGGAGLAEAAQLANVADAAASAQGHG